MFISMTKKTAKEISQWVYQNEYACYSFSESEGSLNELTCGDYFAALDSAQNLFGYVCFGKSAQIPTVEQWVYDAQALDIGLGLKPDLCGKGLGAAFLKDCIAYAQKKFGENSYRLVVAGFNKRAIRVYERIGFQFVRKVHHAKSNRVFEIMTYSAK